MTAAIMQTCGLHVNGRTVAGMSSASWQDAFDEIACSVQKFAEKPKGKELDAMKVDTTVLGMPTLQCSAGTNTMLQCDTASLTNSLLCCDVERCRIHCCIHTHLVLLLACTSQDRNNIDLFLLL